MIRVILFLIVVGVLALGEAWLADRPGNVVVTWLGFRIESSLMVVTAAAVAALAALLIVWSLVRAIVRSPTVLAKRQRERRGARAYAAISDGLIAVGSGDIDAARKLSADANRLAPGEPLTLLLSAQSAQLSGDRDGAERALRAMASRADTKALALHGLFIEARRRGDLASARRYAEEAAGGASSLSWASWAVLEFRCAIGDWAGALALLERHKGSLDKASYRRQRAVLLTAHADALAGSDRDSAKASAREAAKLEPTLVPAAALAGRLLAEGGEPRKAARILDKAWRANPHPELAQAYGEIRPGDSARDRLKRIEAFAKKVPDHIEGALATARAALDAREFAKARAALTPYLAAATKRIALLMAELERAERNDEGRAREWLARALHAASDPTWTADGYVSDRWLPLSPVTGRLDAFEWKVPLTGTSSAAPVIEAAPAAALPAAVAVRDQADSETTPTMIANGGSTQPRPQPAEANTAPVIPLVHAPDDPGPEAEIVEETEAEPEPKPSGWRKLFE